jgi:hypothetical protein
MKRGAAWFSTHRKSPSYPADTKKTFKALRRYPSHLFYRESMEDKEHAKFVLQSSQFKMLMVFFSVADPGCLSRIPDLGSKNSNKREV